MAESRYRFLKLLAGSLTFITIFSLTLEFGFLILSQLTPLKKNEVAHFPVTTWEEVKQSTMSPDQNLSHLSRVLLSWKEKHPEILRVLKDEPQKFEFGDYSYRGEKSGQSLFINAIVRLTPNLDDEFILKSLTSSAVKYKMKISTNEFGWRKTGYENKPERKQNVIFLGCSWTLGDALNDDESLPSIYGKKDAHSRTFNFGITGSSPASILSNMEKFQNSYFDGIDPSLPTIVIFNFIYDHFLRIAGTSQYLSRIGRNRIPYYPFYYLENGKLKKDPNFLSDPMKFRSLLLWFGETRTAMYTGMDFPVIGAYHYRLTARILKEIENRFRKKFPALRGLYVATHLTDVNELNHFETYLKKEKLKVIGNKYFNLNQLTNRNTDLSTDIHPSALYYDIYSEILISDLFLLH